MAQSGFTPILIYSSSTAAAAPSAGNLTNSTLGSELAINITDGKLFYKDNANAVQVIGWKVVPTTAGGTGLTSYTAGDLLFYSSGTTFNKLGIGSANTVLTSSGSAPQWSTGLNLTSASTIVVNDNTNPALRITQVGSGNALLVEDSTNPDATPFVITGDGIVGIGTTTPNVNSKLNIYDASLSRILVEGDSTTDIRAARYSTDAVAPGFVLTKYRGTRASPATVASGDNLGAITFQGFGGTNVRSLSQILSVIETYTSDSNISSYLSFATSPSGSASPTERVRITNAGDVQLSTANTKLLNSSGRTMLNQTGAILQVIQNTTVGNSSTTSTTAVDVTNLTVTITPSSTSSKILIIATGRLLNSIVAATNVVYYQTLVRTTTTLVTRYLASESSSGGLQAKGSLAISYLDSPATTSATTYKIQHYSSSASSSCTCDEGWIIAMEISG